MQELNTWIVKTTDNDKNKIFQTQHLHDGHTMMNNIRHRLGWYPTLSGGTINNNNFTAVPFNSSVTFMAIFASLSPTVAAVIRAILYHSAGDYDDRQFHRLLQIDEDCIVKSNDLQSELVIWGAVKLTSMISGSVALFCLVLYELFRRDPIVRKYCYDRKRLTQPDRSPPPLMTSRSLWRGHDDDTDKNNYIVKCQGCCFPAILELVFLNLSKQYIQYSRAANEARIEREKRGVYTCCRVDWYHRNCCSNYGRTHGEEEGYVTDEDGYSFFPGYVFGYCHIFKANTLTYSYGNNRKSTTTPYPILSNDNQESIGARSPPKTILDLFPEDDPRQYFASVQANSTRTLLNSLLTFDPNEIRADGDSIESDADDVNAAENGESDLNLTDGVLKRGDVTIVRGETVMDLQVETSDREIISNVNNEQGDSAQKKGISASNVTSRVGSDDAEESNSPIDNLDGSAREPDLGYPYRHNHFLLPPGFHNWEDVTEFMADFFFISSLSRWCRKWKSQIPIMSHKDDARDSLPSPGKELEEGEKELLRCAGLDTYLLVRSARFGFDVTFYPFLFSCVTVLPIYNYHDVKAGGTANAYLNLTIEVIPNGSKNMIWIVLFTLLLYLYILRRLWIEWEGEFLPVRCATHLCRI